MNGTFVPEKYCFPTLLALIVAGLAGNYFNFPIFLNIDFLFGSIFALLALQFLGLGRGIAAAAVISGYTYFLWNHPYAIVIMTTEVAIVGWLMGRRKMGMVLADTLFWLIIGMPLVYLSYHVVMHIPPGNTNIIMGKQAVNGIANALVARLIFTYFTLISKSYLISYSEIIYNLLAFFVLCPALIMLAIGSRTDLAETDLRLRTSLLQDSQRVSLRLGTWVTDRKSAIETLAVMAASKSSEQMQPYLELVMKSDANVLRVGLFDREATATAFYPLTNESGQNNTGRNFADRPHLPQLKRTLTPMLSEVILGRIGPNKPIVLMLAPVVINGKFSGFIGGTLSLKQIQEYLDKSVVRHTSFYTLLDKNGTVITSNRTDQTVMTTFNRGKGTLDRLDNDISRWLPTLPTNTPPTEQWQKSFYVTKSSIGKLSEWQLILEQPVAPYQKALYHSYTDKLTLLFLVLLAALALAEYLSRRSIITLEKLRLMTRDLSLRLATDGKEIIWPESGIKEAHHLINNFKEMADSLSDQFIEVQDINESLEQRVEERTEELRQSKEEADAANLAKSRFLSVVAHEFHTPLGLLAVSTDILDRYWERLSTEERQQQHEQIRNAARQMTQLVDSVLAVTRHETAVVPRTPLMLDIGQVSKTIADEVKVVWCADHTFTLTIDPECGRYHLNETHFRHIVANLMTNAFRFTPSGGTVSLNVRRKANYLLITVADSGIGIPHEEQQNIFEAFYRCTNVESIRGLGLGLSIVSEAVQQMNGSIALTSGVGTGTTFQVELPVGFNTHTGEPQQ